MGGRGDLGRQVLQRPRLWARCGRQPQALSGSPEEAAPAESSHAHPALPDIASPPCCASLSLSCFRAQQGEASGLNLEELAASAVEPGTDASLDLPPVMLVDSDMDPHMRMLMEWRIGTKMERAKEQAMMGR